MSEWRRTVNAPVPESEDPCVRGSRRIHRVNRGCWTKPNPPERCLAFWAQEYPAIRDASVLLDVIAQTGHEIWATSRCHARRGGTMITVPWNRTSGNSSSVTRVSSTHRSRQIRFSARSTSGCVLGLLRVRVPCDANTLALIQAAGASAAQPAIQP
jgi:hypothetical protein